MDLDSIKHGTLHFTVIIKNIVLYRHVCYLKPYTWELSDSIQTSGFCFIQTVESESVVMTLAALGTDDSSL